MAPTYIIIKITPKNSTLNINNKMADLKKARIKKSTECTGFSEVKIRKLLHKNVMQII
jgi:hypothetical protein